MDKANTFTPMEKVWFIVNMIPKGKVSSYGKVADLAGLPGRARYVSTALKSAPAHQVLSWHRIINSQGKISFNADSEQFRQQMQLLRLEGIEVKRGKVSLAQYEWQPDIASLVLEIPF